MVIIEVARGYAGFEKLLGSHKWSEWLKEPRIDEIDRVSKIFWCTYSTAREVEKNGDQS